MRKKAAAVTTDREESLDRTAPLAPPVQRVLEILIAQLLEQIRGEGASAEG